MSAAPKEILGPLADIMRAAWPEWYGPDGKGSARADLAERRRPNGLPFGLVASVGGAPVGTVALAETSHGALPGEPVWLNGLVVAPGVRGRGIASALVAAAETAAGASFSEIHTTTMSALGLMTRLGWQEVRHLPDGYVVLRKALS